MAELEINLPNQFTMFETQYLEITPKNGSAFIKNMKNDVPYQSNIGGTIKNKITLVALAPVISSEVNTRNSTIFETCGDYFVLLNTTGAAFMTPDLEVKLKIESALNFQIVIYYYKDRNIYAVLTQSPAGTFSVAFYDKNLTHIRTFAERADRLVVFINNYMMHKGAFFDIFSKDAVGTDCVMVKRYAIDEVIARTTYGNENIKYFLRRIVFGDHECAICNEDMSKNNRFCMVPCGHTNVCAKCLAPLKVCPNCRKEISCTVKMFI